MKILAIGDFHGKFPTKLKKLAKDVDLILCTGDFMPFGYRELWFKNCYKNEKNLWDIIGKKKFKELELKDIRDSEKLLKQLDYLKKPIISITGNIDRITYPSEKYSAEASCGWKWVDQNFFEKISRRLSNFKLIDFSYAKFEDFVFIGYPNSTFPGDTYSKGYKRNKKVLEKLFKKFKKENKEGKVIFISHNCPYNGKLDLIKDKKAHSIARGKHYGSKITKAIISRYRPELTICGHIHEGQGREKISKKLVVNCGAAHDGRAAIIDIKDSGKISVKFIK